MIAEGAQIEETRKVKTKLVTFVTDRGYLVPSLVAASQLIQQKINSIADIRIYTIDITPEVLKLVSKAFIPQGIDIKALDTKSFVPAGDVHFYKNHVPLAALARLSLHEVIEPNYKDIIYLDGDIQIVGDVRDLIAYTVPDGMILAGLGSAWLDIDGSILNRTPKDYLAGLGHVTSNTYFNSGVLAFNLTTWTKMAPLALRFFFENSAACIRHDQSALNAVFKGSVLELAPKYNFHSVYSDLYLQRRYRPAIIHFTGGNKPWGRAGPPWGGQFQESYRQIQKTYPFLAPFLDVAPQTMISTRGLKWHARRWFLHGASLRQMRKRFFDHLNETKFPC
jgi:lipopolysaccharide biosynthesis glycosyltransferase